MSSAAEVSPENHTIDSDVGEMYLGTNMVANTVPPFVPPVLTTNPL